MEENPTTIIDNETLWVEKSTSLMHTVKFPGDGHAMARALSPALYHLIRRIPFEAFEDRFEEYTGNYQEVRDIMNGENNIVTIENH